MLFSSPPQPLYAATLSLSVTAGVWTTGEDVTAGGTAQTPGTRRAAVSDEYLFKETFFWNGNKLRWLKTKHYLEKNTSRIRGFKII